MQLNSQVKKDFINIQLIWLPLLLVDLKTFLAEDFIYDIYPFDGICSGLPVELSALPKPSKSPQALGTA